MKLRSVTGLPLGLLVLGVGCSDPLNTGPLRSDAGTDAVTPADLGAPDAPVETDVVVADDAGQPDGGAVDVPVAVDGGVDVPPVSDVGADVPPVVDAGGPCASNRDCAGGLLCDTAAGRCVQCLTGAQCPAMGDVCMGHRCVAGTRCTSSRTCMGLVCETTRGVCVECLMDVDCTGGTVCRGNACVTPPRMCRSSRECTDQVCDTARSVCVDCLTDVDCPTGQYCGADNLCRAQACVPNATSCVDVTHVRVCDARGTATADRACGATEVCSMNRCQMRVCAPGERSCGSARETRLCNPDGLGYTTTACTGTLTCSGGTCTDCVDGDGDGISDTLEGAPSRDTDSDGTPDYRDLDSDGDGFSDRVEAARAYPGFGTGTMIACGATPDNCDAASEGRPNYLDLDSDNDGVSDADERTRNTNPCARDTDGDGATDLVEQLAGTSPTSATSTLPPTSQVAEVPYRAAGTPSENVELAYTQRLRPIDVMFVVDSTGSMETTITALQTAAASIVDSVQRDLGGASADTRFGVADYRDFANGDTAPTYAFNVRQRLSRDGSLAGPALRTFSAAGGGDGPEATTPALYGLLNGLALAGYGGSFSRQATAADCGGDASAYGWACFLPGRTPVFVVYSDADWHNGPTMASTNFYTSVTGTPTYSQLVAEMNRRFARFIAVDVGVTSGHATPSAAFAGATNNVPASGSPFVFRGSASATQSQVVSAIETVANFGRQNVSTTVIADGNETRLPSGRRTSDFLRSVNALRGTPDAPSGYDRRDGANFVGVAAGTTVTFNLVMLNDFAPATEVDRVFAVYLNVYSGGLFQEQRTVYVLVPAPS